MNDVWEDLQRDDEKRGGLTPPLEVTAVEEFLGCELCPECNGFADKQRRCVDGITVIGCERCRNTGIEEAWTCYQYPYS